MLGRVLKIFLGVCSCCDSLGSKRRDRGSSSVGWPSTLGFLQGTMTPVGVTGILVVLFDFLRILAFIEVDQFNQLGE